MFAAMIRWVSAVVRVMKHEICGVVIASVSIENGSGGSSPSCSSRPEKSMLVRSSRAGVPVFSRPSRKSERLEPRAQPERRLLAEPPRGNRFLAAMDQPAEEGPGRQHDRARREPTAVEQHDAGDAAALEDQVVDLALDHLEVRLGRDRSLHGLAGRACGQPEPAARERPGPCGG